MSVVLALPASGLWGIADVLGGSASRRSPVASVLGVLQLGVLASLHPVVTVLLARWLLAERLRAVQVVGAGAALVGVVLLATG